MDLVLKGPGWVIKAVETEYFNIFIYSLLSGSSYIELPNKLKNSMKGLINIKNNGNKCFLWCPIRHLNPLKIHPERITKADKNMVNVLDYKGIEFPVSKKDYYKIEQKNNVCINIFCLEIYLLYPVYANEKFENCKNLLMLTDENNRFLCNKTKRKK